MTDSSSPAPTPRTLDATLRRVLGVLIEKSRTTPGGYPMSVNAIVTGANQKSNRDPHTALDDADVENALNDLIDLGAAELIDWVGRVPKYKHLAYDWLAVDRVELSVLAELMLRGPQTLGELRGRASRMEPIADLAALKPVVDELVRRGLMLELTPPGRGQLVTHNLYPADELAELRERGQVSDRSVERPAPGSSELAELRAEIAGLERRVRELEEKIR